MTAAGRRLPSVVPHARKQNTAGVSIGIDVGSTFQSATVSVRLQEDGRIVTGASADTDTIVASTRAYINALNKLIVRRQKTAPGTDVKSVSYHGK